MSAQDAPTFVVVGNVNQGKSSIVATLAEEASVPIDAMPGTTIDAGTYAFRVGEETLFRLIDTPGFQDARRALSWLKQRASTAQDRRAAVVAFVREHAGVSEFQDEVRLLEPILNGGGILYVVDASSRFQPSHEAEMEVLRWAGQPAMALLNRTRDRDFSDEWRPILEQFFNVVRVFNAHRATFDDRMRLLKSFRELRDDWAGAMDRAISVLEQEWAQRRSRAASEIADALLRGLEHIEQRHLGSDEEPTATERDELRRRFEEAERKFESEARSKIEGLYRHARLGGHDMALPLHESDLFSEASWRLFGLSRMQLLRYGAAFGLTVGGTLDLMVGGHSFFAGAAVGAIAGGAAGLFGGTKVARTLNDKSRLARKLLPGETGRFFCMGPVTNPAFAWMLIDRALVHWLLVRDRSHALRPDEGGPSVDSKEKVGVVSGLAHAEKEQLNSALRKVLREASKRAVSEATRSTFRDAIRRAMERL